MKNKKLLFALALNAFSTSIVNANDQAVKKYNILYNNMVKNIDLEKTNESNYGLIEKVLNQRNKELKDLYLQNDYIVKPEYLEWQIFFTGFYNYADRGGNQKNIFNKTAADAKTVDLGMVIPIKGIKRNDLILNITSVNEPIVNVNLNPIKAPEMTAPEVVYTEIDFPNIPIIGSIPLNQQNSLNAIKFGERKSEVKYNVLGSSIFNNLNVDSTNGTSLLLDENTRDILITGEMLYSNGTVAGTSAYTYNHTGYPDGFSVNNIGNGGNFEIKGNWDMSVVDGMVYQFGVGFLSYMPYFSNVDSKVLFSGNLELTAKSTSPSYFSRSIVGLSLDLSNQNLDPSTKAVLENSGKIILRSGNSVTKNIIAMQLIGGSSTSTQAGELINSGNIIIETRTDLIGDAGGVGILVSVEPVTKPVLVKSGNILVNGKGNTGVLLGQENFQTDYVNSNITIDGSNGKIILEGERNSGLNAKRAVTSTGNSLLDNVKNMNILINGLNTPAIVRHTENPIEMTMDMKLNDSIIQSVEFGENSVKSSLVQVGSNSSYSFGNVILESSLANSIIPINAGRQNIIAAGSSSSIIINYMPITINSGAKAMIGIASEGTIENYADIVNNSSVYEENNYKYGSVGLALTKYYSGSSALNKGNIDMNGDYATGIYNLGKMFSSDSDHIVINGKNSTAVYAGTSHPNYYSQTVINADKIVVNGDKSTLFFSNGGNIEIGTHTLGQAMELTAAGKDTFAFFINKYYNLFGKFSLNSDVNLSLKDGAIGFYYKGAGASNIVDIPLYLSTIVDTANGKLSINSDDKSYNIAIENSGIKLSDLANISGSGIEFNGSKKAKLLKSKLVLDIDSNIDKNNTTGDKTYRDLEIGKSGVSILEGITLSGTENDLIGIGQSYNYNDPVNSYISSENAGIIDLSGNNSIGMYSKRSQLTNAGKISAIGDKSTGMYIKSGTVTNDGEIIIGDSGVGIYGETYLEPSDNPSNSSSSININNTGKITATAGNKAIGIYGNQNAVAGTNSSGNISLFTGTEIDMSSSKGGVGIYSNGISISGLGNTKITVGENGTGLYIKDSNANFVDLDLNLTGDNSVGVYTDGSASFGGTGNINIDGKGIVVFNVAGSGTFNENFTVNSTEESQYILQNIKDKILYYNSTANLGGGGTFVSGVNSAVLLGEDSILNSENSNLVGIALTGGYVNGLPVNINGEILEHEATNKGKINFGDNSVGIYVINGASGKNTGEISLGKSSVGLYGSGNGTNIDNAGKIYIGENSVGLYNKDGNSISNSGSIESIDLRVIGLYLDGNSNSIGVNTGEIKLLGDKSIGIYISENGTKTINNTNRIEIGSSNLAEDPSIGIFNNNINGTVNNSSDIISGKNSINIYNKGGQINHLLGNIEVGEKGTGIYTSSGSVKLTSGTLNLNGIAAVGVYGTNNAIIDINAKINVSQESYGMVLIGESDLTNRDVSTLADKGVLLYSDGNVNVKNEYGANINVAGSNSIGFYMKNGGTLVNKAEIIGNSGIGNIGIYNKSGNIDNSGNIKIGNSLIIDPQNPFVNEYAVGIYGDGVKNIKNTGNIEVGANAVGFYITGNLNEALNTGNISSDSEKAIGIYSEQGAVRNTGNITLSGDGSIGIAAARNSKISNSGTITMNGNENIGIYAHSNSQIINESTGKIYINGNDSIGVQLSGGSVLENYGLIEVTAGTIGSMQIVTGDPAYTPPSIINAGVIKVDEKFELDGLNLIIKPDPESFRAPTMEELIKNEYALEDINAGFLLSNKVNIAAPSFDFGNNTVGIDPLFTQGTNARVYKFENVFDPTTPEGGPNTGKVAVKSGSLTFDAIPVTNDKGKIDIWMEKINYNEFTQGSWQNEFAGNIEGNYLNATGDALKLYDRLDLITEKNELYKRFDQLAGSVYANINQRESDIAGVFENSLYLLQDSKNNTKENVKINVITGQGKMKDDTAGVTGYDFGTVGVLALREVERTYKHTFGYSLGYLHTSFEMDDNNNSEEWVDTIQLGVHNKYTVSGWILRNDLTGRASIHNIDRNIDWADGRSEMNGFYETYSITSDNKLGKEVLGGKNVSITPYAGLKAMYVTRPSFEEKGLEKLQVEGNDAWSVKPKVGFEFKASTNESKNGWKLKGALDITYEYELANLNTQEKARLVSLEDEYHNLAKPEEENGRLRTKVVIGTEIEDRYGIFLTGEYSIGEHSQDDYRAGVTLKAVF